MNKSYIEAEKHLKEGDSAYDVILFIKMKLKNRIV